VLVDAASGLVITSDWIAERGKEKEMVSRWQAQRGIRPKDEL
jgi:hypothetical protein